MDTSSTFKLNVVFIHDKNAHCKSAFFYNNTIIYLQQNVENKCVFIVLCS